jgi:hypothetical protein
LRMKGWSLALTEFAFTNWKQVGRVG